MNQPSVIFHPFIFLYMTYILHSFLNINFFRGPKVSSMCFYFLKKHMFLLVGGYFIYSEFYFEKCGVCERWWMQLSNRILWWYFLKKNGWKITKRKNRSSTNFSLHILLIVYLVEYTKWGWNASWHGFINSVW